MRERDACPDLGLTREPGMELSIEGSMEMFDHCPAAYLRTASDVVVLRGRFGKSPFAAHLIDGLTHPAQLVSEIAFEVESGARNIDSITPKMREGVHLYLHEKRLREDHASNLRRAKR